MKNVEDDERPGRISTKKMLQKTAYSVSEW